jgi:hypothetical protein
MKSFMLLYRGPATPPDASHEGWPEWFQGLGDRLVDMGSPMIGDGDLNGFSIVRAEDRREVDALVRDHPFLAGGPEYAIDVYEVPAKAT